MNKPDFERHGYRVIEQLGQNYQNGRFTYKATREDGQTVVIKQFKFVVSKDWSGYKAVEREIEVLQKLDHPGIPRILDAFDSGDGVCLVQEYKNAQPLSTVRVAPKDVKKIAVAVLEILVYLQQQNPPVIHRDLKPENILVDAQGNVYLIDFGLARVGSGEDVAASSVIAGTLGFMPPEQLLNRPLTEASDLYGLGATLICLLTETDSTEVGSLFDSQFRFAFKLPQSDRRLTKWLQKMVQPDLKKRFPNAQAALAAFEPVGNSPIQFSLGDPPIPYASLALWFVICCAGAFLVANAGADTGFGAVVGMIAGVVLGVVLGAGEKIWNRAIASAVIGASGGALVSAGATAGADFGVGAFVGAVGGFVLVSAALVVVLDLMFRALEKPLLNVPPEVVLFENPYPTGTALPNGERAAASSKLNLAVALLLTAAYGCSLGVGFSVGFSQLWLILLGSVPLAGFLYRKLKRDRPVQVNPNELPK